MKTKHKIVAGFLNYLTLTIGTFIVAAALVFILEPNTIAAGGVTGFAILVKKMSNIPIDITNLAVNIPLFIAGVVLLGRKFGFKTAYGTLMLSAFIRLIYIYAGDGISLTDDLLLSAIYGGLFMGVGIGLVFRSGGTTGGTDLAGAIIHKYLPQFSIAKAMMALDLVIVISSGIVDRKIETALYSIIALFVLVKVADLIVEGLNYAKEFIIISEKYEEIGAAIIENMDRSATIYKAEGLYSRKSTNVLMCVVNRNEVAFLKRTVEGIDENAFVTVKTVHEVLGEGFTTEKQYND